MTSYESVAGVARQKALEALHRDQPVRAKEFLEAAASAEQAAAAPRVMESVWLRLLDQLRGQMGGGGDE